MIGGEILRSWSSTNGYELLGIDNFSSYYSPEMKRNHVADFKTCIQEIDISDNQAVTRIFKSFNPNIVIHLAGQGGVRASKTHPKPYLQDNQLGFLNLIESSRDHNVDTFIYASSSSVYGEGLRAPFSEMERLPAPKSLYALSKLSNEMTAQYLPLGQMQVIGLRFFTVYGPWARPDMAVFRILSAAKLGIPFELTASLGVQRDFTYVGDIPRFLESVLNSTSKLTQREILNVAGSAPRTLQELVSILDKYKFNSTIKTLPHDELDVAITHGSIKKISELGLLVPNKSLEEGLRLTVDWFNTIPLSEIQRWRSSVQ
jgi:UDP-glucuronate 4-epimerase